MNHVVEMCPLTKFEGILRSHHNVKDDMLEVALSADLNHWQDCTANLFSQTMTLAGCRHRLFCVSLSQHNTIFVYCELTERSSTRET